MQGVEISHQEYARLSVDAQFRKQYERVMVVYNRLSRNPASFVMRFANGGARLAARAVFIGQCGVQDDAVPKTFWTARSLAAGDWQEVTDP